MKERTRTIIEFIKMYVYEYSPSKYPDYPEPIMINLTNGIITYFDKLIEKEMIINV